MKQYLINHHPLIGLTHDYFFNDFSTCFSCSLESYFLSTHRLPNTRFDNMYFGFCEWLFIFVNSVYSIFKPMLIDIFFDHRDVIWDRYNESCNELYLYSLYFQLLVLPENLAIYFLFFKVQCFKMCDYIIYFMCKCYICFDSFTDKLFAILNKPVDLYCIGFKCLWYCLTSDASIKFLIMHSYNFLFNYIMDLIIEPVIYPMCEVLIFLYHNLFHILYEFSYFIFHPTFYKLAFYYCCCSCVGSLPDGFVYFLANIVGPFFSFIFTYTKFFFSFAFYFLTFLYGFPNYLDDVIIYIITTPFVLLVYCPCAIIKLFFSLFNINLAPFDSIYYFYCCAEIYICEYFIYYFIYKLFFCVYFLYKIFAYIVVFVIQIPCLIYLFTIRYVLMTYIYYFPDYLVGYKPVFCIFICSHISSVCCCIIKCPYVWSFSFLYSLQLHLIDYCLQLFRMLNDIYSVLAYSTVVVFIYIKSCFTCYFYIIYTFLAKCFYVVYSFVKMLYDIVDHFLFMYYGGFYSFFYAYFLATAITLCCVIYSSAEADQKITANLVYRFTNRLCILYIISRLPYLIFGYFRNVYGDNFDSLPIEYYFLSGNRYICTVNILIFTTFLIISSILHILKLRDNTCFLIVNFFMLSYVLGLIMFVYGCRYFKELIFVFDNLISTYCVFASSKMYPEIIEYCNNAPEWVLCLNMLIYICCYIYFIYLVCRMVLGLHSLYGVVVVQHRFIEKYHQVDAYGVRVIDEGSYFAIYRRNMRSDIMREVLLKTPFDRGCGLDMLYDEPGFIQELHRVANSRLFREYMLKIEQHVIKNLNPDKICFPSFDTSIFNLNDLDDKQIEHYSNKLKNIDSSDFLECNSSHLLLFFRIKQDKNFLDHVSFIDITNTGIKLNYSEPLFTWETTSNKVCNTIVFKIKDKYNCIHVQEFFLDDFLLTTYCIHITKILKGELRICGDWGKMKFFFTRYFHLSPEATNIYAPSHHYDVDFSYVFLNFFGERAYTIDFDQNQYMQYIWQDGKSRTVLDYLGYYGKKDKFFFLTIFYIETCDEGIDSFNKHGVLKPSATRFLKDVYTDISFHDMPSSFSYDVNAPTTQELVDRSIRIRQWGYDHMIDYDHNHIRHNSVLEDFEENIRYISYIYNKRTIVKKAKLFSHYFGDHTSLVLNSSLEKRLYDLNVNHALPNTLARFNANKKSYSKFEKLVLQDLKSVIDNGERE